MLRCRNKREKVEKCGRVPLFLSLAIVLVGCSEKRSDCTSIPLNLRKVARDSIPYSEFVDSITYVDLETSDNCIIGTISNIRIADGQIVVLDDLSQRVMLFDSIGSYIHDIGSRGLGAGEYIRAAQIDVDKEAENILILDHTGCAVLRYSYDNKFIGKDSVGYADDIVYLGNNTYLTANYNDASDNAGIYLASTSSGEIRKLEGCSNGLPTNKPWLFFYDDGIMSIMTRPYENRLMEWNGNNLTSVVDFIVEPSPTSWQIQEIGKDRMKATEYIDRVVFHNSRRWFFMYFWMDGEVRHIFWDKTGTNPEVVRYLKNDIDGVNGIGLPVCIDNSFVMVVSEENPEANPRLQFLHLK